MAGEAGRPPLARFLGLYSLAYAGGVTAYVPLLVLLLPLKVEAMADASRVGLLTLLAIAGAVAASAANIAFGALSDRSWRRRGSRRRWIGGGLALTAASYAGVAAATTPAALVAAIVGFQVAVNMLLAPLAATMADAVPDRAKGLAGGLLSVAQPVAALIGAGVTGWMLGGEDARLAAVMLCVAALILPLLLAGRPPVDGGTVTSTVVGVRALGRVDLAYLWSSRLCVQIANVVLFTYLLFFFEEIAGRGDPLALASRLGQLTAAVYLLAVPVALAMGRASDRLGVRKPFLLGAAIAAAAGLAGMAAASGWAQAVAGYALFAVASAAFLALQSSYAMQVLPSPRTRGRDLGLFNLANTLPSLLGPALTWGLAADARFGAVLAALAVLTVVGGVLVLPVRGGR